MITLQIETLIALGIPLVILLFSIGVATASVRLTLKRHGEKLDLMLVKQDITNGTVVQHSKELLKQGFINDMIDARVTKLEGDD